MKHTILLLLFSLLLGTTSIMAQQKQQADQQLKKTSDEFLLHTKAKYSSTSFAERMLEYSQAIAGSEFGDSEYNFSTSTNLRYAGDLNGDGRSDFYYTVLAADETTDDLTDRIRKTVVYYGTDAGLAESDKELFRADFGFFEDLNGDGIHESLRYEDGFLYLDVDASNGQLQTIEEIELLQLPSDGFQYRSFGDFDGDGYNDVLVYEANTVPLNNSFNIYLIRGAADLENLAVDSFNYDNVHPNRYDRYLFSDLKNDGSSEIVRVSSYQDATSGEVTGLITTYEFAEGNFEEAGNDTLSGFFENNLSIRLGNISVADLNGDGNQELVIAADGAIQFITVSENEGEYFPMENINEVNFEYSGFSIIGDYNDDGGDNILVTSSESVLLVSSDENLNLTSSNVPLNEGEFVNLVSSNNNNGILKADVNADGIEDLVITYSNQDIQESGYRVYFGNADGNFDSTSEVVFTPNMDSDISQFTFNAGDLNGDGIEDFGIVYQQVVELHFGGGSFAEPDLEILPQEGNYYSYAPAIGDFNNDGFSDLVLNISGTTDKGLYFYFGGSGMDTTPDHQLLFADVYPDIEQPSFPNEGITAIANIGDINGDGIEDLFLAAYQIPTGSILLGGSSLSAEPDVDFPVGATNVVALGDFMGTGVNHFALWNFAGSLDAVHVFAGYDEAAGDTLSSEPVLILPAPAEPGQSLFYYGITMASGDFNGDDTLDLAVSPYFHQQEGEGLDAIYIYAGGAEADSIHDAAFPLLLSDYANAGLNERIASGEITNERSVSSIGELTMVPDMNGDGADELMVGTTPGNFGNNGLTNAGIYYGNADLTQIGVDGQVDILLESRNPQVGLGSDNNNILSQTGHSAVGDFNGNGTKEFVLPQYDFNFQRDYVYLYEDPTSVSNEPEIVEAVRDFKLEQNYPNPFNPSTVVSFQLPVNSKVKMEVFDITGRLVSTLVNEQMNAGTHSVKFDASHLSSGVYIYRLKAADYTKTRKMLLIK